MNGAVTVIYDDCDDCARRDERAGLLLGFAVSCGVHGIALAVLLALDPAPPTKPLPAADAEQPIVAVLSQRTEVEADVPPPRRQPTAAHAVPKAPSTAAARKRITSPAEVVDTRTFVAQEPASDVTAAESEHAGAASPGAVGQSSGEAVAVAAPSDSEPVSPPSFSANYLDNPAPAYPSASRRLREQGRVLLLVDVAADGLPRRVNLATSSGSSRLDEAALDAVRRWRFVPARKGTKPVPAQVLVPIVFGLSD